MDNEPTPPPGNGLAEAATGFRTQPHALDAEQALLGAILVNNEAYHRVAPYLRAEHFYEPVHARMFEAIDARVSAGRLADPVTLRRLFEEDEALKDVDGGAYLAALARAAESIVNAEHYGKVIHDLALKRGLIRIGEDTVTRAYDPSIDDSGRDLIEQTEAKLFGLAQEGEVDGDFKDFTHVVSTTIRQIETAFHKKGEVTGVPSQLRALDQKLGGMQPSDLLILAARPSMGKTALALTIAANAAGILRVTPDRGLHAADARSVAIFSLEMSAEQLTQRLLSSMSGIDSDALRKGDFDEREWENLVKASALISQLNLHIDDTPALSVAAVRTRARRLMRQKGLALIVVDYLQLLRGTSRQGRDNRVLEIGEISQTLKAIAKELHVPVLALSQLSRQVENREDKRPQLSDLRDSGTIEQDADVVMFLYREEYYLSRSEPQQRDNEDGEKFHRRVQEFREKMERAYNRADVIVAKQRNGPIGTVPLQFDSRFGRFNNLEMDARGGALPR